jgi:hypothetical protein
MTDSSSEEDNSEMAEMMQDLLQAKMDMASKDGQMTHVLRVGTFLLEIVPDKKINIEKFFKETMDNLFDRFGEKALKVNIPSASSAPADGRHYG